MSLRFGYGQFVSQFHTHTIASGLGLASCPTIFLICAQRLFRWTRSAESHVSALESRFPWPLSSGVLVWRRQRRRVGSAALRRGSTAATWTIRSWWPAPRSFFRYMLPERCCWWATATRAKVTGRGASKRWEHHWYA